MNELTNAVTTALPQLGSLFTANFPALFGVAVVSIGISWIIRKVRQVAR